MKRKSRDLDGTLIMGRTHVIIMSIKGLFYFLHDILVCTGQRIPSGCQYCDKLDVIGREPTEEFHSQYFAQIGPRKHHIGKSEVRLSLA
jgi:hypothetical protein